MNLEKKYVRQLMCENQENKSEATFSNRTIDFENIGCGFDVYLMDTEDRKYGVFCQGFSNNTSKSLDFVSNIPLDKNDSEENREKFHNVMNEILPEIREAANEFDNKIASIFKAHGFEKK